jgi:hypothetical protein
VCSGNVNATPSPPRHRLGIENQSYTNKLQTKIKITMATIAAPKKTNASQSIQVIDLINVVKAAGVQTSPYVKGDVIAEGVEGIVEDAGFDRKRLVIQDETGRLTAILAPGVKADKGKYDLVIFEAEREFTIEGRTFEKGHKVLKAA